MSTMRGLKRDRPVSGAGLGPSLLPGFTAVVSRPPPVASFSLCALRLFVIKRTYSLCTDRKTCTDYVPYTYVERASERDLHKCRKEQEYPTPFSLLYSSAVAWWIVCGRVEGISQRTGSVL